MAPPFSVYQGGSRMDYRSQCPIASGLDIFGDRWTLVVLRNIFLGHRRYNDHLRGPEGISTNILADRLALLEREGLIVKVAYQDRPPRHEYHLTRKGAETLPVMQAIARWSLRNIADRWQPAEAFMDATPDDVRTAG